MKRTVSLFLILMSFVLGRAQYTTPGTGVNWTMDNLVENSGGVVVLVSEGTYQIFQDITISPTDTVSILQSTVIMINQDVLITIQGVLFTDVDEEMIAFMNAVAGEFYKGLKFDNSTGSYLKNVLFSLAGGIKLVSSGAEFTNCLFTGFNQGNCTGTIDLFQSNPLISGCLFQTNAGPAVLSAANGASSPQIMACSMSGNVSSNSNMPQINLGTSGTDSIRIVGCEIIGNPELTQVGGIAITTLAGGSLKARIEDNYIKDNRYGITQYGSNIGSIIRHNDIVNNDTQGDPMLGGSGINFYGNTTNQSTVTGNVIAGNLWGITIQNTALPNLGQVEGLIVNPGMNRIFDNGNSGEIYDLYNNTPNPIMAEYNDWGTMDPDSVEAHIFHQPDNPALGFVDYLPFIDIFSGETEIQSKKLPVFIQNISPNPANDQVTIKLNPEILTSTSGKILIELITIDGKLITSKYTEPEGNTVSLPVKFIPEGLHLVRVKSGEITESKRLVIAR